MDHPDDFHPYAAPVSLSGRHVQLIPLEPGHADALWDALREDEEIWRYLPVRPPQSRADMGAWIAAALEEQGRGLRTSFAVVEAATGRVAGTTSLLNLSPPNRSLDIGWTWYARRLWRSGVNTECKLLLLTYAFETLGCVRVQFRVDERNLRSRQAVERIGGVLEGVLRKVQILHDGHRRNVAIFSMLDEEWPARREWLRQRLAR